MVSLPRRMLASPPIARQTLDPDQASRFSRGPRNQVIRAWRASGSSQGRGYGDLPDPVDIVAPALDVLVAHRAHGLLAERFPLACRGVVQFAADVAI